MQDLITRANIIIEKVDIAAKNKKIAEIELAATEPKFWDDKNLAAQQMKELALLQKEAENVKKIEQLIKEKKEEELESLIKEMELSLYLSGKYDKNNAIVSIHAGQGGVDAMDWAAMLLRMYERFVEKRGWNFTILSEAAGEEAGVKSVSLSIEGDYAYGYLKGEQGTHRLVRLSPFNAGNLRQTSFALVEVIPQLAEIEGINIQEEDLEWDFYRASSHGGQNVQKVSSAVRLKHIPSGIVVTSQAERYQGKNRENAIKLLKAKLWAIKEEEKRKEKESAKGEYVPPSWGNQIRNYVLHPYKLVKDTRTGTETSNVDSILNGDIDQFVEAELKLTS